MEVIEDIPPVLVADPQQ
jgi:hypothetical protein